MSTSQAHAIANEIENRLVVKIAGVTDALVHIEPAKNARFSPWQRMNNDLRGIADGMGLGLHDLHIHTDENGDYIIELHLEMQGGLSLVRAHELADEFEAKVKRRWPQAQRVLTHLEPIPDHMLLPGDQPDKSLEERIRGIVAGHLKEGRLIEAQLFYSGGHLHTSLQLRLPQQASLAEAHALSEQIETDLLKQIAELSRVTLHVEPEPG
jgi:divalent metal cation (Fe/Co/Zn/Cd) transporter